MKSNKPSNHSQKTKFLLAIIAVLSLAAIVTAGIVIKIGRVSNEVSVEQSSSRRFAGRGGNSSSVIPTTRVSKNSVFLSQSVPNQDGTITGATIITDVGIQRTVRSIMIDQSNQPGTKPPRVMPEHEIERDNKADSPNAPQVSQWPPAAPGQNQSSAINAPQTTALSFDGATLTDTGAFPPDSMGAVGPTQFVTFVNGRLRTFTKNGVADGVLNADPDVFFSSVKTPVAGAVVLDFTSDPNVRYDRFTGRWFLTIIDVPCTNATCTTTAANRLLIAVSDAASAGTISAGTVWTFFQFQADPGTNFLDYPSLGVDVNALYVGGNMFSSAGSFVGTNGYVIRKSTLLGAGPVTVTMFANLATSAGAGPFSPRGVDNFDSSATEGYFVGVDTLTFSTLMFRRVSNPGSATPTISANISVTVPTTALSGTATIRLVQHAGNTGGNNGLLDTLDDRLYAAMIRSGRLWTAHNFRVDAAGVANTAAQSRNAVRWYEFQNLTTTPTTVQSGTVFDNAATRAAARQYWIPSVTVNGQGHAVLGFTMAGTPSGATPAYVGRLAGDTLGTMTGPPTVAAATFGTTTANYNPAADPGGAAGRRWGDYSYTSLDPLDDMTIWTIQEYNQASNSYAVRVGKLLAPPPASPTTASPSSANTGQASVNVTITGTSSSGSGFYDPGANLTAPALPFTHISASVTGGVTVNSVTYTDPTHITLNISTVGASAGAQNITITNPDGQTATGVGILTLNTAGTAPTFTTCPTNQTVSTDIGACSAAVAFAPVASGSPSPTITCKIGATTITSPFNFPVGTSNVVCTATNGVAPDATCSFSVTVNDTQLPTVTCPANISTPAATNQCSAVVTYTTPTASDNCAGATVTCSPASGSTFNVGTTTVTCTPKDAANNTGTACTFTVTVNDTQPPTIGACPANIMLNGSSPAVVNYTVPTASDNCSGATVTCVPASGSTFNVGTTTVTCTSKDAANNTGATCSFTVTITPCTITCPANQVAWTAGTSAAVTYPAPTTSGSCGTTTCTPASGSAFNVGTTTVTCNTTSGPSCSFTVTVNKLTLGASLADPLACAESGDKVNGSFSATNTSGSSATVSVSATLTNAVPLPNTAAATQPGAVVVLANVISWTGTLGAGQTVTVNWMGQIADNLLPGMQACSVTTATVNSLPVAGSVTACVTLNCQTPGPAILFPPASEASDQKAGSVLIYNIYTSGATSGNTQNTRINITNSHPTRASFVHLFFVAEGCSIADSYICLTGNQTASFLASDLDPGTTGYLVAVAVDGILGCPTSHNYLIGDEYVKFTSGHAANLGAIAFTQIAGGLPLCDGNSVTAALNFDGVSYNRTPAALALDNVGSRADGNDTLLILNRIGGNLGIGASTLGTLFGVMYDDAENALSFNVSGSCQLRNSISNNFPRTTPRFETFVPAGRTGWLKVFNQTGAIGITGAAINFNPNASSSAGAFNQGHNLHKLTLTNTASYIIPIFPPSC